jgi:hypothetical protein
MWEDNCPKPNVYHLSPPTRHFRRKTLECEDSGTSCVWVNGELERPRLGQCECAKQFHDLNCQNEIWEYDAICGIWIGIGIAIDEGVRMRRVGWGVENGWMDGSMKNGNGGWGDLNVRESCFRLWIVKSQSGIDWTGLCVPRRTFV